MAAEIPKNQTSIDIKTYREMQGLPPRPGDEPKPKVNKYRNLVVRIHDYRFDSIAEGAYYLYLMDLFTRGELLRPPLLQVRMHCVARIYYKLDFMVFYSDGRVDWVDVKGVRTPEYRIKKAQVEERYNMVINEVERKDIPAHYLVNAKTYLVDNGEKRI